MPRLCFAFVFVRVSLLHVVVRFAVLEISFFAFASSSSRDGPRR